MDEHEKKRKFQWVKTLTNKHFWEWMDDMHSAAYGLAQKHYFEAMSVVLPPRYRNAVLVQADKIREQWDNITSVTVDDTGNIEFKTSTELIHGLTATEAAIYNVQEPSLIWRAGRAIVVRQATAEEIEEVKKSESEKDAS